CRQVWPELQIVLSAANDARRATLDALLAEPAFSGVAVTTVTGNSRALMAAADLLLVASGTVTLEALLLKKPMVVCYRMAPLSYALISRLVKVPYFSLPNLLARRALVPEFVQEEVNAANLFDALRTLRENTAEREDILRTFEDIHRQLRRNADERA